MRMEQNRTYTLDDEYYVNVHAFRQLKLLRHYSVQQATHMMTHDDVA